MEETTNNEEVAKLKAKLRAVYTNVVNAVTSQFDGNEAEGVDFLTAAGIPEKYWGDFGKVEYEVNVLVRATLEYEVTKTVTAKARAGMSDIYEALEEDGFDADDEAHDIDWSEGEIDNAEAEIVSFDEV